MYRALLYKITDNNMFNDKTTRKERLKARKLTNDNKEFLLDYVCGFVVALFLLPFLWFMAVVVFSL